MREIEIKANACLQNEAMCRVVVSTFLIPFRIKEEELMEVKTLVSEGVCNAIIHGSKNEESFFILKMKLLEKDLFIEIQDFGEGIEDIDLAMTPLYTSKADEERSGMGFTIMNTFADELRVESKKSQGVTLRIRKGLDLEC